MSVLKSFQRSLDSKKSEAPQFKRSNCQRCHLFILNLNFLKEIAFSFVAFSFKKLTQLSTCFPKTDRNSQKQFPKEEFQVQMMLKSNSERSLFQTSAPIILTRKELMSSFKVDAISEPFEQKRRRKLKKFIPFVCERGNFGKIPPCHHKLQSLSTKMESEASQTMSTQPLVTATHFEEKSVAVNTQPSDRLFLLKKIQEVKGNQRKHIIVYQGMDSKIEYDEPLCKTHINNENSLPKILFNRESTEEPRIEGDMAKFPLRQVKEKIKEALLEEGQGYKTMRSLKLKWNPTQNDKLKMSLLDKNFISNLREQMSAKKTATKKLSANFLNSKRTFTLSSEVNHVLFNSK